MIWHLQLKLNIVSIWYSCTFANYKFFSVSDSFPFPFTTVRLCYSRIRRHSFPFPNSLTLRIRNSKNNRNMKSKKRTREKESNRVIPMHLQCFSHLMLQIFFISKFGEVWYHTLTVIHLNKNNNKIHSGRWTRGCIYACCACACITFRACIWNLRIYMPINLSARSTVSRVLSNTQLWLL